MHLQPCGAAERPPGGGGVGSDRALPAAGWAVSCVQAPPLHRVVQRLQPANYWNVEVSGIHVENKILFPHILLKKLTSQCY